MPSLQGVSGPEAPAGGEDAWPRGVESSPGDDGTGSWLLTSVRRRAASWALGHQGTREGAGTWVLS